MNAGYSFKIHEVVGNKGTTIFTSKKLYGSIIAADVEAQIKMDELRKDPKNAGRFLRRVIAYRAK